ncbi:hypothetical protein [Halorhabdus rudnickae]|uniref:hypothetical protein n=1 Tax=Halorhabdus rudnickae TaxID=1775544 RepID=UPI00108343BB|nr:hypothetical protein [Halorhabdus rudnickae]
MDAVNGTLKFAEPLFTAVEESEFDGHFTQVRKCNQIEYDESNDRARRHCAGAGQFDGYLYEEMDALDPEAVITITTRGGAEFSEVFGLPRMKTKAMAQGSGESGFRVHVQDEIGFRWYPAPHPRPAGAEWTFKHLDSIKSEWGRRKSTREYFKLFVDEVLEDFQRSRTS